ncbi:putative two component, sigma54 specific, transcriptional regulator, Fis family [Geobacter metallireducens RCH3]|nr:putative two component, sigma54 specific, transcriptional regulator, Fis family [Geobacter metallireducens RCH3]
MTGTILIVDDERAQREIIQTILEGEGYRVAAAPGGREALEQLETSEFDVILTDLKMQGMSGMELLERVLEADPLQCAIMMTAHGTVDSAVEAMKKGAFDYLEKPLERDNLLLTLRRAFERVNLLRENRVLQKRLKETSSIPNIIGEHPKMREVFRIVTKIAPTASTVLIYGESGTGKELVAKAIHDGSPRKDKPFFAINCAAIPESLMESELFGHEKGAFTGASSRELGIFEAATGGTVFLDEIGEMSVAMQAKLLRAIQSKEIRRVGGKVNIPVDVRIISATNRDLEAEIKRGGFREDLFYRLNVIRITLPPPAGAGERHRGPGRLLREKVQRPGGSHRQGDRQTGPEAHHGLQLARQRPAVGIGHRAGGAHGGKRPDPARGSAGRDHRRALPGRMAPLRASPRRNPVR